MFRGQIAQTGREGFQKLYGNTKQAKSDIQCSRCGTWYPWNSGHEYVTVSKKSLGKFCKDCYL